MILSLTLHRETAEVANKIGVAMLPMNAFGYDLAAGALCLKNEGAQRSYFVAVCRRLEREQPGAPFALPGQQRYQNTLLASVSCIAAAEPQPWAVDRLAVVTVNSLAAESVEPDPGTAVDIALRLRPDDVALLRIYDEVSRGRASALLGDEIGYRLGDMLPGCGLTEAAANDALTRLQKLRQLEARTDVGLDPSRPYLPACRLTSLGRSMLKLLAEGDAVRYEA